MNDFLLPCTTNCTCTYNDTAAVEMTTTLVCVSCCIPLPGDKASLG